MKYILLVVLGMVCFFTRTNAQLRFGENGVAKFSSDSQFILEKSVDTFRVDVSELDAWNNKSIAKFKNDLKGNLKTTIETLGDTSLPAPLTKWLLDTARLRLMKQDLQKISDSLDSPNLDSLPLTCDTLLRPFVKELDSVFHAKLYNISDTVELRYHTYTLTQEDLLSRFLTMYYISLLKRPENALALSTTLTDYHTYYTELKHQYDTISSVLQQVYRQAKPEVLEKMYISHKLLAEYLQTSKYIKLLKLPVFAQWLWSTGGALKLNPLDFSSANVMDTVPELDLLAKTYTRREFIARNNRLLNDNSVNWQKLSHPAQVTNEVVFPIGAIKKNIFPLLDSARNQYFLLDAKEKNLEIAKIRPLDRDEKIYLLLLNIDKGYKARYRITETKQISGNSPTEDFIDTIAGTGLRLYNLLNPQMTVIRGVISAANMGVNKNTTIPKAQFNDNAFFLDFFDLAKPTDIIKVDNNVKTSILDPEIFWREMEIYLRAAVTATLAGENTDFTFYSWNAFSSVGFNDTIFNAVKRRYKKEAVDSVAATSPKAITNLQAKIVGDYLGRMYTQQMAPIAIDSLRYDSLYIAQLINVMAYSSLPVTRMETSTDTVPKYRSSLLVINDRAENVEQTLVVDRYNTSKSDTIGIVTAKYKKGSHSLVEPSVGMAYTFPEVRVISAAGNKVTSNDERYRVIAALHFYPFKTKKRQGLYKIDEPFFGGVTRINFMLGVGIPKPLDNYYLGAGYDFGPGLKLNGGIHFHKYRQYIISNDEIIGDKARYKVLTPYISLSLNPELVVRKILEIFKNI